MQPLISVIIPVYNVEAYLSACVESVLAQTYQNTEIILVDDGSPDNCPAMCDAFAAQDSRIRVIHKENGGLASARNAGIKAATGEYLAFLDSDDLWSPHFLERLYRAIQETNADFAVCQFRRFQDEPEYTSDASCETLSLTQHDAFECLFNNRNENMVVAPNKLYRSKLFASENENMVVSWNKLYQADLFDAIRYPEGKLHEDEAVIHEIIGAAKTVAWVDEAHYHYRQAPNSITTSKFNLKRLDETYAKEQRITYLEARGMHELADRTRIVYLSNLMRLYRTVQNELADKAAAAKTCRELYRKFTSIHTPALMRQAPMKLRLRCMLFRLLPKTYAAFEHTRLKRKGIV